METWLATGRFTWKLPLGLGTPVDWQEPGGKPPCDWWGINFYSRAVLTWWLQPAGMPRETMTDMFLPIYPEGMYDALKAGQRIGLPMYITEVGLADAKDDRRGAFIDAYLSQILRAMAEGADVRGIYYWTLVDNFEVRRLTAAQGLAGLAVLTAWLLLGCCCLNASCRLVFDQQALTRLPLLQKTDRRETTATTTPFGPPNHHHRSPRRLARCPTPLPLRPQWPLGFTMRFGLYRYDPDGSVDRQLREGAKALARWYT